MSQIKYWNLKEHKPRLSIKALPLTKSSISVQTFLLKKFQFGLLFPCHKPKRARFWNLPRNFSGKLNIWIQTGQIEKFLDLKRATPSMFMFRYITFSFILREPKFKGQFELHEFLMCERLRARNFFICGNNLTEIKVDSWSVNLVVLGNWSIGIVVKTLFGSGKNLQKNFKRSFCAIPESVCLLANSLKFLWKSLVEKSELSNSSISSGSKFKSQSKDL